jgi:hypothetical protein
MFISRKRKQKMAMSEEYRHLTKHPHTTTIDDKVRQNSEFELYTKEPVLPFYTITNQSFHLSFDQNQMNNDNEEVLLEDGFSYNHQQDVKETIYKVNTNAKDNVALTRNDLETGLEFAISPLKYWKSNQSRFPALSEMARKYLSINATSVPSERLFSRAKRITNTTNANLSPDNVKANVLLACWSTEIEEKKE